jgi:hypothetical protein
MILSIAGVLFAFLSGKWIRIRQGRRTDRQDKYSEGVRHRHLTRVERHRRDEANRRFHEYQKSNCNYSFSFKTGFL